MLDFRKLYDKYEDGGEVSQIREVDAAEEEFTQLFHQIRERDTGLAEKIDSIAGKIARAYSMQGFRGGLMAASEVSA